MAVKVSKHVLIIPTSPEAGGHDYGLRDNKDHRDPMGSNNGKNNSTCGIPVSKLL